MTSILALARWPDADTRQHFFWVHPEWWATVLCGSSGAAMLFHGWQHAGHEVHHWISYPRELGYWMLMVAAMMLPFVRYSLWLTAIGSLWPRRHRAIAGFLAGFFGPWMGLGLVVAGLRELSAAHTYAAAALGFGFAAFWRRTSVYRQALVACHRTVPLAPVGWRADRDCLRFGGTIGGACLVSCWPLMLSCALAGHSLIALAASGVAGASERHWFGLRKRTGRMAVLMIAVYYVIRAAWEFAAFPRS
jgi:hypothetical protein